MSIPLREYTTLGATLRKHCLNQKILVLIYVEKWYIKIQRESFLKIWTKIVLIFDT